MPDRIVLVHDDAEFVQQATDVLVREGYQVITFGEPTAARDALMGLQNIRLLITRVDFGPGQMHGVTLGLLAKDGHRDIEVIFASRPYFAAHALQFGEFLRLPVSTPDLIAMVKELLPSPDATPTPPAHAPLLP